MLYAMRSNFLLPLLVYFSVVFAVADYRAIIQRQDGPIISQTFDSIVSTTASDETSQTAETISRTNEENAPAADRPKSTLATPTTASSTSSTSAMSGAESATDTMSNINGAASTPSINLSTYNSTLTPSKLPITPRVTPALGIAGVILILSGIVYTFVGLKNKLLHISLSAAYLSSLAVTVLIIYVMNPPISDTIQGAYLVAIVITGIILGGACAIFSEMTEGLGCLLGGYCVSMWLLVLKPGGLLATTSGKSIFIAALTVAAFASSLSQYTRPYGLISGVSFAGATAVVLGIDCFSLAGLKEFWAYVWNLNDNLFPIGATSYPVTRGMKVEIVAIIILFLAGMVSQTKLWKVTKERREARALGILQIKRTMEQEEESVGRRIEYATAEDRKHWEATYCDSERVKSSELASRDSGVGDMESKQELRSDVQSVRRSDNHIETAELPSPTSKTGPGLVMSSKGQTGSITIRVAPDMEPSQILHENRVLIEQSTNSDNRDSSQNSVLSRPEEEKIWFIGADGLESRPSQRDCKRNSLGLEIIPFPFRIPKDGIASNRSSVATCADDVEGVDKRNSQNLPATSQSIRKLSGRSARSHRSSQNSISEEGVRTEDLVISRAIADDRASSLAATVDGLSDIDDLESIKSSFDNGPDSTEVASRDLKSHTLDPTSVLSTATDKLNMKYANVLTPTIGQPLISHTGPDPSAVINYSNEAGEGMPQVVSAVATKPASITKDRLPPQVSKVVMFYRTNEWAKHLSSAYAPEIEDLNLSEHPYGNEKMKEIVAPVNIKELQQTAETGSRPASIAASQMSNCGPIFSSSSSSLSNETPAGVVRLDASSTYQSHENDLSCISSQASQSQLLTRRLRPSSIPLIPQQIVESPLEDSPSFSPTIQSTGKHPSPNFSLGASTLMGKRDSILRSKPFYISSTSYLASIPKPPQPSSHTGSSAGSVCKYPNTNAIILDDDSMSLSARRQMIRQSSLNKPERIFQQAPLSYDSYQPKRQSSASQLNLRQRQQQMASWRASIQQDLQAQAVPKTAIERSRSALWHERQQEEQKRMVERNKRGERDSKFDEMMRRGDMLNAHREVLRKMQANANKHA
ncbi:unnamed protein product [Diplocarpon coronariae]